MANAHSVDSILEEMAGIAGDPLRYAAAWKRRAGRKVVGVFPMNFPVELVHAAGALPVLVQESPVPITLGRSLLFEFYCGYTRSVIDQAATGQFDTIDAFFLVDHCVALLGAADAMRFQLPDVPIVLAQFPASMDEDTSPVEVAKKVAILREELEDHCGPVSDEAITRAIALYNRNRQLQREIYALRRGSGASLTASQMQVIVKSSMVMDIEEHNALLETLVPLLAAGRADGPRRVKLHLSGHFCHAPRPQLLEMIESCGSVIVDDDLFTGYRFISTDVSEQGDPAAALVEWYFARNRVAPCSTRAQKDVDWETFLSQSFDKSGAEGVVILMAKFCEPHMLYFPELRKEFNRRGIPFLLIETEHEGLAIEMLRTRVEALIERIRRNALAEQLTA